MLLAFKTLGIDLVDSLSARGTRREPTVFGNDLDASYRVSIPRRLGPDCQDLLTSEIGDLDAFFGKPFKRRLLQTGRGRLCSAIERVAELFREFQVDHSRILIHFGRNLRR